MNRRPLSALLAGLAATAMFASSGTATGTVMFGSVPDPLPTQVAALGYGSYLEFGQVIGPPQSDLDRRNGTHPLRESESLRVVPRSSTRAPHIGI